VYYSSREKFLKVYEIMMKQLLVREDVMKKLSLAFLVVLFSVVALLSTSTTVLAAPATKEPFSATMTFTGMSPPERLWTDEEGVQHVRGLGETFSISGSIVGTVALTVNWNFVVSGYSQSGDAQAKGIITSGEDVYLISADVTEIAGTASGTFVIRGTGSCKGIHVTGTLTSTPYGQLDLEGTKLTTKP
jgi:hypothetical protein